MRGLNSARFVRGTWVANSKRMRWAAWVCAFSFFGCSDGGAVPADAGPDASGPKCGSDQASSTQACGTLAWDTSSTESRPRNHHMTYLTHAQDGSAFLVAVAGVNGSSVMHDVDIAPIAKDGTVGAFTSGPHYGVYVGGLTGANVDGVLVGAGGNMGTLLTDMVFTSVVQPDGSLADWQKQTPMNVPRMHAASFALGSRLWIMGGFDTAVHDDVIFADVGKDGTIATWYPGGKLDRARTHFAISFSHGFVFVTGGIGTLPTTPSPTLKDVQRGTIEPDGTIDQWTQMTPMPAGICTHSSFVYGGWLYVAGGIDDNGQTAVVRRAPIDDDGTLGSWETAAPLPIARGHVHQLPIENDRVYSVSGATDYSLNSTSAIFVGSFL